MTEANYDEVICPNCVTQFRAVPVNVQNELKALAAQLERLQYEVDAIPAIKEERDDLSSRYETASRLVTSLSEALAKSLKERDALKAELARPESTTVSLLRAENAALKDAARLALDALERILYMDCGEPAFFEVREAIAALKAVL